jgi:hypothetical protein
MHKVKVKEKSPTINILMCVSKFLASCPIVWTRQTSCKQYSPTSNHTAIQYKEGLLNAKLSRYQLKSIGIFPISNPLLEHIEHQINNQVQFFPFILVQIQQEHFIFNKLKKTNTTL